MQFYTYLGDCYCTLAFHTKPSYTKLMGVVHMEVDKEVERVVNMVVDMESNEVAGEMF